MTAPLQPTHQDRARALRVVLGVLNKDADVIVLAAQETATPRDVDRFMLALADQFAMLARRRLDDPVGYLESWIALELQLAEDAQEQDPPSSQSGGVG